MDLCDRLPLYEGVDWNGSVKEYAKDKDVSPSLRGSGLKFPDGSVVESENVSLPLYEGVDWNVFWIGLVGEKRGSPSLRGSGLK